MLRDKLEIADILILWVLKLRTAVFEGQQACVPRM